MKIKIPHNYCSLSVNQIQMLKKSIREKNKTQKIRIKSKTQVTKYIKNLFEEQKNKKSIIPLNMLGAFLTPGWSSAHAANGPMVSSQGKATAAPRPRKTVRREILLFLLMDYSFALRKRNGSLMAISVTRVENLPPSFSNAVTTRSTVGLS